MTMSDQQSLLRGVLADPADNVARLVYADWLEENGESERAIMIREGVGRPERFIHPPSSEAAMYFHRFQPDLNAKADEPIRFQKSERLEIAPAMPGIQWETSRGFVSNVSCNLQSWIGGPCPRCHGRGGWETGPHSGDCTLCDSTGRTPAHGPRIVAEQPVEVVEVSDKRPQPSGGFALWGKGGTWFGYNVPEMLLPDEIFDMLNGEIEALRGDVAESGGGEYMLFESVELAQSDLSLALLNWARREAGLPPLRVA